SYTVPAYYEVVREPVLTSPGTTAPPLVTESARSSETLPPPKEVIRPAEYATPATEATSATVNLLVPTADAEVWVDGRKVQGQGTARRFVSPALGTGERFTFS